MIIISRESLFKKNFDVTEKQAREELSGEELEEALKLIPTDEEREWMRIFKSTAPDLERTKRKISVCLDAEVKVLEDERLVYDYCNSEYEIKAPTNSFKILRALESGRVEAFGELAKQGCVKKDGKDIDIVKEPVDSLNLLLLISYKFFFQIYL